MLPLLLPFLLLTTTTSAQNETLSSPGGNSTDEDGPLILPSFTYEATDDDIKEAAYRYGVKVRDEPDNKLILPNMDIEGMIQTDQAQNWQRYRYNPYYAQQKRYELMRQLESTLRTARSNHRTKMVKVCYQRCNAYINETFERPDLSSASNGSLLLQQLEMAEFPAKYLTMELAEMKRITAENCEQWEADYQCIFGCTSDAELVDRMKSGLAGDFHLTANVECPNPNFAKFLPCVGEKVEEWVDPCMDRIKGYQQVKAQANARIMILERQAAQLALNITSSGNRYYQSQLQSYIGPYVNQAGEWRRLSVEINSEQSKMCAAYGDLLMCALGRLKSVCNERATSFVHTSLSENFASQVLQGKDIVKKQKGGLSRVCLQLANKGTFRIFPIKK